ncbi:MAG: M16 family metallopeptidase [Hyphomicrobiales bacterium]
MMPRISNYPFMLRYVCVVLVLSMAFLFARDARAVDIQQVKSPGGIEAWLVEDRSIPLITVRFAFEGGTAGDPKDLEGVAHYLSGMLDEGAGDLPSKDFQKRVKDLAMRLSFEAGRDRFYGTFQTLSKNRDEAFGLLALALNEPRFDDEPLERVRKQIILGLKSDEQNPNSIAARSWMKIAFGAHPYARATEGTIDSVQKISADDLQALTKRLFTQEGVRIAVVGDIDAKTLGTLLDKTFGTMSKERLMPVVPEAQVNDAATVEVIERDIPQSVIQFGHAGIGRKDEDFIAAYILNYILGGGGFGSRLTEEIREKRGLTYSVYSYLSPFDRGSVLIGGAATQNKRAEETVSLIRKELERMATEGPTDKELREAKTYLTGSYPLRFDTSKKIASQLLAIQIDDLGLDYIDTRNDKVRAVTLDDVKSMAKRLLKPGELIITIVGKPDGLKSTTSQGG